jgi:uncharacterized membrane protein YfcA
MATLCGALRSAALMTFNLNPIAFLATSTIIDFGGDVARLGIYLKKGYLNPEHYFYIPLLFLTVLGANFLARSWIKKVPQKGFRKVVLLCIFLVGLVSIISGFVQ